MRIVPRNGATSYLSIFRSAVYTQFHQHATGKEPVLNVTGDTTSIQLTYAVDPNTIISAVSRTNFRELFAVNLARAGYAHRDNGETAKQREAEDIVITIGNLGVI
jgi:seryl-tRNA(Sec) selenium transferase